MSSPSLPVPAVRAPRLSEVLLPCLWGGIVYFLLVAAGVL